MPMRAPADSLVDSERFRLFRAAAGEEARNRHQDHRADRGRRQAAQKSERLDSEPREDPAADHGADQPQDDNHQASEPSAARNLAGNPSGNQTNDDPQNQPVRDEDEAVSPRGTG